MPFPLAQVLSASVMLRVMPTAFPSAAGHPACGECLFIYVMPLSFRVTICASEAEGCLGFKLRGTAKHPLHCGTLPY